MSEEIARFTEVALGNKSATKYDIGTLNNYGVTHIWHHYTPAPYEGSGWAAMRLTDGRWVITDLGHCSCYGPFDRLPSEGSWRDTLPDAIAAWKTEPWDRVAFDAVTQAALAWKQAGGK